MHICFALLCRATTAPTNLSTSASAAHSKARSVVSLRRLCGFRRLEVLPQILDTPLGTSSVDSGSCNCFRLLDAWCGAVPGVVITPLGALLLRFPRRQERGRRVCPGNSFQVRPHGSHSLLASKLQVPHFGDNHSGRPLVASSSSTSKRCSHIPCVGSCHQCWR